MFCLKDAVVRMLAHHDQRLADYFNQHFHYTGNIDGELIAINRYWRYELGQYDGTLILRSYLCDTLPIERWLHYMETYVICEYVRIVMWPKAS